MKNPRGLYLLSAYAALTCAATAHAKERFLQYDTANDPFKRVTNSILMSFVQKVLDLLLPVLIFVKWPALPLLLYSLWGKKPRLYRAALAGLSISVAVSSTVLGALAIGAVGMLLKELLDWDGDGGSAAVTKQSPRASS